MNDSTLTTDFSDAARAIADAFGEDRLVRQLDLAPMTTYRVGGPARISFFPQSPEELARAVALLHRHGCPFDVLGRGSNVLVSEKGISHPLIVLTEMDAIHVDAETLIAEAGADCTRMAAEALAAGLTGLEFMHCLPGSAGGAAFMNARAFGQEMSGVLRWARVVDRTGDLTRMEVDPTGFKYKHSPFMEQGLTVAEVGLKLERGDPKAIEERMEANETHRRSKGEMDYPCCGCVFKNPQGGDQSAGGIIDSCGLKGLREGGAWVSEAHANFVVHDGAAAPSEIRRLMERVRAKVAEQTGRSLVYEVRFLGDFSE